MKDLQQQTKKVLQIPNLPLDKAVKEMGRNPFVDWVIVVLLSFAVGCVLVIGGGLLFYTVSNSKDQNSMASPADTSTIFNEKELSRVIEDYDARAANTSQADKAYAGVADPSH